MQYEVLVWKKWWTQQTCAAKFCPRGIRRCFKRTVLVNVENYAHLWDMGQVPCIIYIYIYPVRCAHNPPPCRFFISWFFSSRIFLILGYQILMILSDFGSPGALFLMIFEYFGCLGTLPGGLGHILSPRLGFLWFWRPLRHEKLVLFEVMFDTFCIYSFCVFLSVWFSGFFVSLGAQRLHFGKLFGSFLGALGHWKVKTKKCVWTAQACADCISSLPEKWLFRSFLVSFLRVLSGRPLEHDFLWFWPILGSLRMTI